MLKRTNFLLTVIAGISLCMSGFALAFGPHPCDFSQHRPDPRCMGMAMQNLDLTDDQQAALEKIKDDTCAQIEPLAAQLGASELYKALSGEEIDQAEVAAKIAEIVELKSRIAFIRLNSRLAVALILTPEQRQKMSEEIEACRDFQPGKAPGLKP